MKDVAVGLFAWVILTLLVGLTALEAHYALTSSDIRVVIIGTAGSVVGVVGALVGFAVIGAVWRQRP